MFRGRLFVQFVLSNLIGYRMKISVNSFLSLVITHKSQLHNMYKVTKGEKETQ